MNIAQLCYLRELRKRRILVVAAALVALALTVCGCRSKGYAASESCYNKLRQIDGAKQYWAQEHHKSTNDVPSWEDLREHLKQVPEKCPGGGTYTIRSIGELPTCSIPAHEAYWKQNMEGL